MGNYHKPTRSVELFLDAGKIQVSLDSLSVVGTPLNDALRQFEKTMKKYDGMQFKSDSINKMLGMSRRAIRKEFIKQNIHNGIGRLLFHKLHIHRVAKGLLLVYLQSKRSKYHFVLFHQNS